MKYKFLGSTVNGNWAVSTNDDGVPCVIQKQSGWGVGTSYIVEELGQTHFAEHDAHLIAAAPDLLQVCITTLKILEYESEGKPNCFVNAKQRLTNVIHKALNLS